jgi:hypothetical protein
LRNLRTGWPKRWMHSSLPLSPIQPCLSGLPRPRSPERALHLLPRGGEHSLAALRRILEAGDELGRQHACGERGRGGGGGGERGSCALCCVGCCLGVSQRMVPQRSRRPPVSSTHLRRGPHGAWWVIGRAVDGVGAVQHSPRQALPNLEDRFPYFPASPMASSSSTCYCSGASRRRGVAVSALFSVIFILWRWLFTLLGGSSSV